ncbi:hypothetical protein GGI25_002960 [Coemansia spiralis]|uniref:RPA43 OB domain-containing protein n=2 Tax=Coemansia TaxID=4863 RepID=A0A9W8G6Y3_9FUNG|nr:hypothetical protein BX070DRAFT_228191 [Coemansia spiralis]KAJ1993118.1 hypothetical protein EDC05_002376 [Coemansia umbellata]KAJ2623766.1 hypothetical protein GGI26_002004 [Coemansia sp. RSA 1358]KAJ2677715.1 hypothetical protein GGI25_002960 [Coemansia spiralis]
MGEKRKSRQKESSSKKSRSSKKSSSNSKDTATISETNANSIPYPKAIHGSSFVECMAKLTVTLSPVYSRDSWAGIHETLNSMLLRFVPQVRGVVLSYSKVKQLSNSALMFNDSPFSQLKVAARLLLWRPIAGMSLRGSINVQSPDHIGLLLWDTFNASIPASFIPKDKYEWRPFSDDEISVRVARAAQKASDSTDSGSDEKNGDSTDGTTESTILLDETIGAKSNRFGSGEWVLKGTSECIGADGNLEFVVVDVIRANEVLSVTGALR